MWGNSGVKLLLVGTMLMFPCAVVAAEDVPEPRLITVTGDADVKVVPDEVVLILGIETWGKELSVAKAQHDERMKKLMEVIKEYEIDPKHVQTDYVSLEPRYSYNYEHRDIGGYFVRKSVVVTLKDLSKFESLLSSVLEAGVNYVHGVDFRTTGLRKYRDQARAMAIQAAREKAVALAKELGEEVGRPHKIDEHQSGWGSWYGGGWWGRGGGMTAQNVAQTASGIFSGGESTIALGQITVNAQVSTSFELK